jgi:hypothetical protein
MLVSHLHRSHVVLDGEFLVLLVAITSMHLILSRRVSE